MIAELEGAQAPESTQSTPATPETSVPSVSTDVFEYFLGDKASKLPSNAEFAIKHAGQVQRIPASKLINNYRQSAHLETKLKELTGKLPEYEKKAGLADTYEKRIKEMEKYEQLQKWSEENPEQFQYVWDSLQKSRDGLLNTDPNAQPGIVPDALHKTIQELRRELGDLKTWKTSREEQEHASAVESEMGLIENEINDFGKKYEKYGVKLDEVDEEGISLRGRILKFAADNKVPQFEAAALMVLKDTLFERAGQMARQETLKSAKGDVAAGVLSRSSIPNQGQGAKVDVKKLSAEDRRKAALEELTAAEA